MDTSFTKILDFAISKNASDIHYQTGKKPIVRIAGKLMIIDDADIFEFKEEKEEFLKYITEKQYAYYIENGNADFAFGHGDNYRFRGNIYRQHNGISMSLRLISNKVFSFEELNLPIVFQNVAEEYKQGFFLIVGPTGSGKSTTLAAIINHINNTREEHIITIEDPVEYIFQNNKSVIEQREVGIHASSFQNALRACMRQDPDIIMVGEMRDYETMQTAVTLAETGHMVFSTMHTNNAAQTIDRIIDTFPEHKQKQVRIQLADTLTGVMSQRLVEGVNGELVFAYEKMIVTNAIKNIIREEKSEQIYNAIQQDEYTEDSNIIRLEQCLAHLVKKGKISKETALQHASSNELIDIFLDYE